MCCCLFVIVDVNCHWGLHLICHCDSPFMRFIFILSFRRAFPSSIVFHGAFELAIFSLRMSIVNCHLVVHLHYELTFLRAFPLSIIVSLRISVVNLIWCACPLPIVVFCNAIAVVMIVLHWVPTTIVHVVATIDRHYCCTRFMLSLSYVYVCFSCDSHLGDCDIVSVVRLRALQPFPCRNKLM